MDTNTLALSASGASISYMISGGSRCMSSSPTPFNYRQDSNTFNPPAQAAIRPAAIRPVDAQEV